jgi:N-acetylglucosaminyl-diphospho-decaprenol L-rhamnosyltransferase
LAQQAAGHRARMDITVVIATRDRRATLLRTLPRHAPHQVVVVDDASSDGTADAVGPPARVLRLAEAAGAAARNAGVAAATTPLVAFCDDDSWFAPGALERAARHFTEYPRLGLLAARVLVGDDERPDPACVAMARGAIAADAPGPLVHGFVACGAVARRDALLQAGGFHARYGIGGEEALLALDLAAAGWAVAYAPDVVAHHHAEPGPRPGRARRVARNDLWTAWLRRRPGGAARATLAALRAGRFASLADAARGLPWVLRERRPLPAHLERRLGL